MKKALQIIVLFSLFHSDFVFSQAKPTTVAGLKLWLHADSLQTLTIVSSNVSQWKDCSTSGNNASQANSAYRPVYTASVALLNSKPVLQFDGTDDYFNLLNPLGLANLSLFILYRETDPNPANIRSLFGSTAGTQNWIGIHPQATNFYFRPVTGTAAMTSVENNNYTIAYLKYDGSIVTLYKNGNYITNFPGLLGPFNSDMIGNYNLAGFTMKGDIAEIIAYDNVISENDRNNVELYLQNKYAPPVNLGPDINVTNSFCSTTLNASNRYESYLWSTTATTQTIQVNTSGTYTVTVTDVFGHTSSDAITVTYPHITLADTLFCAGSSVTLSSGLVGAYTYHWSTTANTPTINVSSPGNYSVTVTGGGCSAVSNTITVTRDNFPTQVSLGINNPSLCLGIMIGLVAPSPLPPGPITYLWNNGATTATIPITGAGLYHVTVTNSNGCVGRDTIQVTILGSAPSVDFSYIIGCSGDSTHFHDLSSSSAISWSWDFGDGNTSSLKNPAHLFSIGGTYNVKLTVSDGACPNFLTKQVHIPESPVVAFSAGSACLNSPYPFTDQSTSSEGTINSWDWNFGDGSAHSSLPDPSHTFNSINTFNISLTITTDLGCVKTIQHPMTILSSAPDPGPFSLYMPSDSMVTTNNIINFGWNASPDAIRYTLQYSTDNSFNSNVTSIPNLTSTTAQQTFGAFQTYFWHIIAYGVCSGSGQDSLISSTFSFTIFSPDSISGIVSWLMGGSVHMNGSNVDTMYDNSGSNNFGLQTVPSNRPSFVNSVTLLNYKPIIQFDGLSEYLNFSNALNLNNCSIFLVYKNTDPTNIRSLFGSTASTQNWMGIVPSTDNLYFRPASGTNTSTYHENNNYNILCVNYDGQNVSSYKNVYLPSNGSPQVSGAFNPNMIGNYSVPGFTMKGDIAEIIVYNSTLNTSDRLLVENYLRDKYAPPVNLGPDIWSSDLCDTTLEASQRFTNYIWSTGETSHSIVVNSGGTYSVTATDVFGFKSVDEVIVHKPIIAAHDTLACFGTGVTLNTGLSSPYTFNWQSGQSTSSTFTAIAPDTVHLIVADAVGCFAPKTIIVSADSFPVQASLGISPLSECIGDTISLAVGTGETISYLWSDGSSGSSYLITPTTPTAIAVTVTDANQCVATLSTGINIHGTLPAVNFSATSVCEPNQTTFINQWVLPLGTSLQNFQWDFGDSATNSTDSIAVHSYLNPGIYNTTLTVTTNQGCTRIVSKPVYLYSKPHPNFTPYLGCTGVPLQFQDHSTNILGNIFTWDWTINDPYNPQFLTDTNPTHIFDSVGDYNVHLVLITDHNCTDSMDRTVHIRFAPKAGFTYTNVCEGYPVSFTDTSQTETWDPIFSWNWDFGDGQTSTVPNPVITYTNGAGTYYVTLAVKAINGCVSTEIDTLVIHGYPDAILSLGDLCANTPIAMHDSSTVLPPDVIVSWAWDFGSFGSSNATVPVITFPDSGVYIVPVTLTVASNAGCESSTSATAHILPVPIASFQPDYYYGVAPLTVCMNNTSSPDAISSYWNFGNDSLSSMVEPCITYLYNDTFWVTLTVQNQYSCSSSDSVQLFVVPTIADIAVSNVVATKINDFLSLTAKIKNVGSQRIYAMEIYAKPAGGAIFKEDWSNYAHPLLPDSFITYTFNAQYELPSGLLPDYVCVEAQIVNHNPDDNPLNNEQCITFANQFIALDPYPTPVHDNVHVDFILPFADQVVIDLYDAKGAYVKNIFSGPGVKGLNKIDFDVSSLSLGVYNYRVIFREDTKILRFVKY